MFLSPVLHGLLAALCLCGTLAAQAGGTPSAADPSQSVSVEELQRQLAVERGARQELERRMALLEERLGAAAPFDEMERRLAVLVEPGGLDPAAPRAPGSPAFYNPTVGVFMDATVEAGNFDSRLGEDSDKLSLRETEIDMRLPLSPFATGVGVFAWENAGNNEFEALIEEGYADISLGGLFDQPWETTARIGRFRPQFGRNNQLHLHDWLQVNQPLPVRNLLGSEGVVGEGVMFNTPLFHTETDGGRGATTTLNLAVVNGDLLTGEEGLLGGLAEDAALELDSKGELLVARLSQYLELDTLSDLELGASILNCLGSDAVQTDATGDVDVAATDFDLTWRSRDDETGVGSWLVQAETIRSSYDDDGAELTGDSRENGWWLTLQRQVRPTVYLGLLYGESDVLGSDAEDTSIGPYLSWYADEFFRVRTQLEHVSRDSATDGFSDANRLLLQFTWNFGAHQPHPYWVNK